MEVSWNGGTPQSSILTRISILNYKPSSYWGTPILGHIHILINTPPGCHFNCLVDEKNCDLRQNELGSAVSLWTGPPPKKNMHDANQESRLVSIYTCRKHHPFDKIDVLSHGISVLVSNWVPTLLYTHLCPSYQFCLANLMAHLSRTMCWKTSFRVRSN